MTSETLKTDFNTNEYGDRNNTDNVDYYKVMLLKSNSNDIEIKETYRQSAVRYDPEQQKNKATKAIFAPTCEAHDVLSDPLRRAVYDQYGEEGLKNGAPRPEGFAKPYIYHSEKVSLLMGSPFTFSRDGSMKQKEESLIKILFLTLSEVFFGGIKKMKIRRLVLVGDDKSTTVPMEKILTIPIKPGIPAGTRIVFPGEGDQGSAKIPADVIFVTEDRPHETFRRVGSDLHTTVDIFLKEALTGTVITLKTVDDRTLRIPITSIVTYENPQISPDYMKRIPGEGMPFPANPRQRGDLILRFNVEFPTYLPLFSKNHVKKAFEVSRTSAETAEDIHRLILASKTRRRNIDDSIPIRRGADDDTDQLKFICET